jgi:hypothetical protein
MSVDEIDAGFETLETVPPPSRKGRLTNQQILLGEKLDPLDVIKTYDDDKWEEFIREWIEGLQGKYAAVRRASGAGDKGRDVIGYVDALNTESAWDNYQCKHYDHGLHPSDIWKELAKLCYYTFLKKYSVPRAYYFVAPLGVGPEALSLLESPEKLRVGIIEKWQEGNLLKVGRTDITLVGQLLAYVEAFDFSIVKDVPPQQIIEEHRTTRHHPRRFGGGLVKLPPNEVDVPPDVAAHETRYVQQLLLAYGERVTKTFGSIADLDAHRSLRRHLDRQRRDFYLAELLRNYTRDSIDEEGCFERLQDAIYDGVIDTAESEYANGFERLKRTIEMARIMQIDSHPLRECLEGYHRSGICHQLANDERLTWVP